jgi:hypothetical protein
MTTASLILLAVTTALHPIGVATGSPSDRSSAPQSIQAISPYWSPNIQRWNNLIVTYAGERGLDPDLVAAVIRIESAGYPYVTSSQGAIGLMQVMPFANRPSAGQLYNPDVNVSWGTLILSRMLRQSAAAEGDLLTGVAAYIGGWNRAGNRMPRRQGTFVLDAYIRAVAVRQGLPAESADDWALLVQFQAEGQNPAYTMIEPGYQPSSRNVQAEHLEALWPALEGTANAVVYTYHDEDGAGMMTVWLVRPELRPLLRGE